MRTKITTPTTNWLASARTTDELRLLFRVLAKRWHPDRPAGNLEAMQQINLEYSQRLAQLEGSQRQPQTSQENNIHNQAADAEQVTLYQEVERILTQTGLRFNIGYNDSGRVCADGPASYTARETLKSKGFWWDEGGRYWHFVKRPERKKASWNNSSAGSWRAS